MIRCMRTTVRLDEALLTQAKKYAAESGRTLTAVLEDALREKLARRDRLPARKRVRLLTVEGGGLLPGVDLDDSAAWPATLSGSAAPATSPDSLPAKPRSSRRSAARSASVATDSRAAAARSMMASSAIGTRRWLR